MTITKSDQAYFDGGDYYHVTLEANVEQVGRGLVIEILSVKKLDGVEIQKSDPLYKTNESRWIDEVQKFYFDECQPWDVDRDGPKWGRA